MAVNVRSVVGAAALWVAVVCGTSAVAWVAIDRAGRGVTDAPVGAASASPSPTARPATSASNPASGGPSEPRTTAAPSTTVARPQAGDRSTRVPGGQVAVRCAGARVSLRFAKPDDGWRVEVDKSGPDEVEVSFRTGDGESERKTNVSAECASGVPQIKTEAKS